MSEKTEKATSHKLKKAKEQGQVSKSNELNTSVALLIILATTTVLWPSFLDTIKEIFRQLLTMSTEVSFTIDSITKLQKFLLSTLTYLWLPFALSGMLALILTTIAQTGFVWSFKPLAPDFKRLDLSKGFKRLFSIKLLFEAGKNTLKLTLSFLFLMVFFRNHMADFTSFITHSPRNYSIVIMHLLLKMVLELLAILLLMATLDKLYTRWKYAKDNRMSKQEVKDEYRQREGCPKIKAKIKQLQQQQRQKAASVSKVKTADVVITNPTHLAVALKYDRGVMTAPQVVCKAQGELVKLVKSLAARHRIPIIENKPFARALFSSIDLNQSIQREHFPIAALIFREIYQQKEKAS